MKAEIRTCENCGKTFIVRPDVIKSEKRLHIKLKVCDKCQRKEFSKGED